MGFLVTNCQIVRFLGGSQGEREEEEEEEEEGEVEEE